MMSPRLSENSRSVKIRWGHSVKVSGGRTDELGQR
jgi:hypothetical protein